MERRVFTYLALALLVWAVSSTAIAGYYFNQYSTYRTEYLDLTKEMEFVSLRANVFVSYGNGTRVWHNDTALPINSTGLTAIQKVAEPKIEDWGELGLLVTSIDGLSGNSTHGWFFWFRETGKVDWTFSEVSCAKHFLHRGDTIAFTYQSYGTAWPPPFSP